MTIFIPDTNPVIATIKETLNDEVIFRWSLNNVFGIIVKKEILEQFENIEITNIQESEDIGIYRADVQIKDVEQLDFKLDKPVFLNTAEEPSSNSVPHVYKFLTVEQANQYLVRIEAVYHEGVQIPKLYKKVFAFPKDCIYVVQGTIECDINGNSISMGDAFYKLRKEEIKRFKNLCYSDGDMFARPFYDTMWRKDNVLFIGSRAPRFITFTIHWFKEFDVSEYPEYIETLKNVQQILKQREEEKETLFQLEIKKKEEETKNKIKQQYLNDIKNEVDKTKKVIADYDLEVKSYVNKIREKEQNKQEKYNILTSLENKYLNAQLNFVNPYDLIKNDKHCKNFLTDNDNLIILLKDMAFYNKGEKYALPESIGIKIDYYRIEIICKGTELTVGYNNRSLPHPHAINPQSYLYIEGQRYSTFTCCWGGETEKELSVLLVRRDIVSIYRLVVNWLKAVNDQDGAGKYFMNWKKLPKEIIETPKIIEDCPF
jgi:hypothetical protein